jgi:photosystem II stability/assembly factor-like uncharacterized protein
MMATFKISVLLTGLFLLLSACGTPAASSTTPPQVPEQPTASIQPTEIPPTPVPDTPAPPAINAPVVEAPALVTIHFLNELDAWGLTETQVVRTNDGGITWHNVTPPDVTEAGYSVDLAVFDNDHVWMQKPDFDNYPNSGFLYRTLDGGITWTSAQAPFSRGGLHFLDPNNGWAFADLGSGAGSNAVAVYQTSDGGATWNQTYLNDPNNANAGDSLPLSGMKSGLTPLNMQTAWVSGVVYSDGTVYLYRTDDGGANWSQVTSLALPPEAQNLQIGFQPVQFVSAQDAFVTVRIPSEPGQMAVYISNDAGNTWTLTPTLIPNGNFADFLSATDAVIYNGEQFYVTHDVAQTWSIVSSNVGFGDTFTMMDFVNPSAGWVITLDADSHRSLYRTTDGGATWSLVIP